MTADNPLSHEEAWDQIPWLINGTLDDDDQAAVQAHIETCVECSAEMDRQQRLNEVIGASEAPYPSQALALEAIAHRLAPPQPANTQATGAFDQISALIGRLFSPAGIAFGGAIAAVLIFVVVSFQLFEPRYETLTSPDEPVNGVEIRLRFQITADPAAIRDLMTDAGALNVTGPSESGLMRGVVKSSEVEAIVDQLRADPRIVFIAEDR